MRTSQLTRDNLPHLVNCAQDIVRRHFYSALARLVGRWWGVDIGKRCRFYGMPIFRRMPGSRILIGDDCQFRSATWSNMVGINRPCILSTFRSTAVIEIGKGGGFSGTAIGCADRITLGERVMCGGNVSICDTDWHSLDWRERAADVPPVIEPVVIEDDVWLGMNVTVLKGVHIGARTVVGAGSLVTKDLPADVIAAGQPAKVIRELPKHDFIHAISSGGAR